MNRPRNKFKLGFLLSALLLIIAGCQAVGGLDLNGVLKQSLKTNSAESKETISFKMSLTDDVSDYYTKEEESLLRLFSDVTLRIDDAKKENNNNGSLKGALLIGGKEIGFALQSDAVHIVLQLDGAKRPIVLNTAESQSSSVNTDSLNAIGYDLLDKASTYVIDNMPNPKGISVTPKQETVNGEQLSLMDVHTEWNASQVVSWVKSYVSALIADAKGREAAIIGILETLSANQEFFNDIGVDNIFDKQGKIDGHSIADTASSLSDELGDMLESLSSSLDSTTTLPSDEQLSVKADLFVDSKLDIRKSTIVASFKPDAETIEDNDLMFKTASLTISSENWNINGDVKADRPTAATGALKLEDLQNYKGYQVAREFNTNSAAYDLLRNKLHVGKQTVYLSVYNETPIIITPAGITLIPLRDTAYYLGANLNYNSAAKTYTFYDDATRTKIELKNSSKQAVVNGKSVAWSFPLTISQNTAYVPARDLAKAVKATLEWNSKEHTVLWLQREVY